MSDVQDETFAAWTVDTLRVFLLAKIADQREMLQERYQQQTKAVDAAFSSQQTAMQTAKTEQTTAMNTALDAQKDAINAAMAASDKATAKAETAADKRFEESNGYRQQLQNQAATFATKDDMDVRMKAFSDKLDYEAQHLEDMGSARDRNISSLELRLTSRLDLSKGQETGTDESRTNKRQDTSLMVSLGSFLLVLVSVAIAVITALSK